MYASFAFAGFYPPVEAFDSYYFDGSAIWDIDIFSAINQCLTIVDDPSDIVVDVIMTSSADLKEVSAESYNSIEMLFRYLEVASYYSSMDGILRAQFAYPDVDFRYAIAPSASLDSSLHPMSLDQDQMDQMYNLGVSDAKTAVTSTSATRHDFKTLSNYFGLKKSNDARLNGLKYEDFLANENGVFSEYNAIEDAKLQKTFLQ